MCFSASDAKTKHSRAIEKELKAKNKMQQHKILLLGTGNSGKSTFCKQLTSKFGGTNPHFQASNEEILLSLKENTLAGINKLITETANKAIRENKEWPPANLAGHITAIQAATPQTMTKEVAEQIVAVFGDDLLAETLSLHGDQLALPGGSDGVKFFVKNIVNYVDPAYQHTPEDLLRNRVKTTGIIEVKSFLRSLLTNRANLSVMGLSSSFVTLLVREAREGNGFTASTLSVNEYDVGLEEANHQNAFTDSIQQWKVISDLQCFKNTPFIVFFNKVDLLEDKLKRIPLNKVFRDYEQYIQQENKTDENDEDKAISYFEGVFAKNFGGEFCEYHKTCALDPDSCIKVFESVQRSILQRSLEASGLTLG